MMKILLLSPRSEFPDVTPGWLRIEQMSLLILEALSDLGHQVRSVEEEVEPVPFDEDWDLVGITAMTATAHRAYDLARRFRKTGAKLVLGGIHPSVLPNEAAEHADAVVVGEAEGVWEKIIEDARHDQLHRIYSNQFPDIQKIPIVRYKNSNQKFPPVFHPVVASRGCPQDCEFCSVTQMYGRRFRRLPVKRVIEQIRWRSSNNVMFLDDNLAANRSWALELFESLKPYKLKIITQVPTSFILDDELFDASISAGLSAVFVGIETIDEAARTHLKKAVSIDEYKKAILRCRKAGVFFHAAFIFGMDSHDTSIFNRTLDFIMEQNIPSVSAYVLTPYPGTALFKRLRKQNRLLHQNWSYYDHLTPVFRPQRMSFEELTEGYLRFRQQLYSLKGILFRFPAQVLIKPLAYIAMSLAFHRTTGLLKEHYKRYFDWLETQFAHSGSNRKFLTPKI
jgi:radical SAM superfamily enzyme YgiQ (UPF0313 family)